MFASVLAFQFRFPTFEMIKKREKRCITALIGRSGVEKETEKLGVEHFCSFGAVNAELTVCFPPHLLKTYVPDRF